MLCGRFQVIEPTAANGPPEQRAERLVCGLYGRNAAREIEFDRLEAPSQANGSGMAGRLAVADLAHDAQGKLDILGR